MAGYFLNKYIYIYTYICIYGDIYDVMVTIIGNGHNYLGSNPGWGSLHFTEHSYTGQKNECHYFPSSRLHSNFDTEEGKI